jgi:hypothetical protein
MSGWPAADPDLPGTASFGYMTVRLDGFSYAIVGLTQPQASQTMAKSI